MYNDQRLKHIEEISKNARATWFSLLIALLFCGVTLLDVEDRDFFAYGAATKLPLIGVEVPVVGFFLSAPVLVLALYLYLHVYLAKLWRALAPPFGVGEAALDDHVYPWLLSDMALRLRPDVKPRDFGWLSTFVSLALGWAFAPFILAVFWIRSWPYHHEWLTLFLAGLFLVSLWMGVRSFTRMRDWMMREGAVSSGRTPTDLLRFAFLPLVGFTAVFLFVVSWQKTEGPLYPKSWGAALPLYSADLYRLSFVQLPDDRETRDVAWENYARKHRATVTAEIARDPAFAAKKDDPQAQETEIEKRLKADFRERREAAIKRLPKKDWPRIDLRSANLREANLSGLDLRKAQMHGANLINAQMEGANLTEAKINGASLIDAQIEGAKLRWAKMDEADLRGAQMNGVDLRQAQMDGADLTVAQLDGANLVLARMEGVDLSLAQMSGALLSGAQMTGANLNGTNMNGADLVFARIIEANFQRASIIGTNLSDAEGLTQEQLDTAYGDAATLIPGKFERPDHWAKDEISAGEGVSRWRTWMIEEQGVSEEILKLMYR